MQPDQQLISQLKGAVGSARRTLHETKRRHKARTRPDALGGRRFCRDSSVYRGSASAHEPSRRIPGGNGPRYTVSRISAFHTSSPEFRSTALSCSGCSL